MRTLNTALCATKPSMTVLSACPSLRDTYVFSDIPAFVTPAFAASWSVTAPSSAPVTARPKSRVEATGVGYAAPAAGETRRGVDGIGRDVPSGTAAGTRFIGNNGTNGKQQDQLHLMSRRDPRTCRPPA